MTGLEVTKTWEAYGEKGIVFYQHLDPFDKAQESLAKLVAQLTANTTSKELMPTTIDFITYFLKTCMKARIKVEKYNHTKEQKEFNKLLDGTIETLVTNGYPSIHPRTYAYILYKIGMIYDELGYNRVERQRIRTPVQSDIQLPGMETPEEMEIAPSED